MYKRISLIIALALLLLVAAPVQAKPNADTTIVAVNKNESVTVALENFPSNETYYVYMNYNGTYGVNGYLVSKLTTNSGGTILAEFPIPAGLVNEGIINIRFQSLSGKSVWWNWFYNETSAYNPYPSSGSSEPTYNRRNAGTPWFTVTSVVKGVSISGTTSNFPENERIAIFVKDGAMDDENWVEVSGFETSGGGVINVTFSIPSSLKYKGKIAYKFFGLKVIYPIFYSLVNNWNYP